MRSTCNGADDAIVHSRGGTDEATAESAGRRRPLSRIERRLKVALRDAFQSAVIGAMLIPERWRSGVAYNPLASRTVQDPYPDYARLRSRSPVHRSRLMKAWVFSRHADVDLILRDHRHFSNAPAKRNLTRRQRVSLPSPDDSSLLFIDPPDHTRLRSLVSKAFTRRAINALESHIRRLMETLLDEVDPAGFDLMEAVADPLPQIVIAEMLGVPPEDRTRFCRWSKQRARIVDPTITRRERELAEQAARSLDKYFLPIIRARRKAPEDDIISALVQVEEQGDVLTEKEMLEMLCLLLVAGNETTTNLIGNGMLALLRNPDQFARLREDPSLIPSAVEELLRFDSPVQMDFRGAVADCEVNGFALRQRDQVVLLLGSANHDPTAFPDAERLDVGRRAGSHISFGRGIHYCLGAPLALLEGRVALEVLMERFASMRLLDERPVFRNSVVLRGLESLPVAAVPA